MGDALLGLFWQYGYDQVSQQQMAAATGLSTSSLYNSFGTKAEIYEAVMRRYMDVNALLLAPLEHGERGLDDLDAFLDAFEQQLDGPLGTNGCLVAVTMSTLSDRDEIVRQLADEHRERLRAAFTPVLERAGALGEPVPDPAATAPLIVAVLLGVLTTTRGTGGGQEARDQFASLRALASSWRGVVTTAHP